MGTSEFNTMLVSNSDFLKPFAVTLTRDSEVAKDLFQETLYRAIANRENQYQSMAVHHHAEYFYQQLPPQGKTKNDHRCICQ